MWVGVFGSLLYLLTLGFGLLDRDDPWLIKDNQLLKDGGWSAIYQVFFDFSWEQRFALGAEYLPLRDLSVMFDYSVFGDAYSGHHLTQVLLYGLACAFAALLVDRWTGRRALAWVTGLVFAAHPIHVEAVAWLSERKGVLGAVFLFASLNALHRYMERGGLRWWFVTVALFICAVFSKAHMVAGLGAALLLVWMFGDWEATRRRMRGMCGLLVIGALCFVPAWSTGRLIGMVQPYHEGGFVGTVGLFAQIHALYLKLAGYVGPYAIHYPITDGFYGSALQVVGMLALLVMVAVVFASLLNKKCHGPVALGLGWWLIFLLPVSHLLFPIQNLMADRYMLLPSFGFALVLASMLLRLPNRLAMSTIVVIMATSSVLTFAQTKTWSSPESMWTQASYADPGYATSWEKRAYIAQEAGDFDKAWRLTEQGLAYAPNAWPLHHRQAWILRKQSKPEEALAKFKKAAAYPKADTAQANLALILLGRGELAEARKWAQSAVSIRDKVAHNQRVLGKVALQQNDIDVACAAFDEALKLGPYSGSNHFNMALCKIRSGDREQALKRLHRAAAIDPKLKPSVDDVLRTLGTP